MVVLLYIVMCLIFGTTFLFIKVGLSIGWSPMLFASLRFSIAGVIVLWVMWISQRQIPKSLELHKEFMMVAFLMTTIPFTALYQSEQYITSGMAAILVATAPVFIVLFNRVIHKKRMFFSQPIGIAICLLGILLIVLPQIGISDDLIQIKAQISLLLAEVAFAYGSVRAKRLIDQQMNPFVFNGLQMFYGGLFLFLLGILGQETFKVPEDVSGWILLVYFIVVASIISNGIYYWLMKKTNALFPSTWTYVAPVIAMALGWAILGETFSWTGLLGAGLVLIGIVFTNVDVGRILKKINTSLAKVEGERG